MNLRWREISYTCRINGNLSFAKRWLNIDFSPSKKELIEKLLTGNAPQLFKHILVMMVQQTHGNLVFQVQQCISTILERWTVECHSPVCLGTHLTPTLKEKLASMFGACDIGLSRLPLSGTCALPAPNPKALVNRAPSSAFASSYFGSSSQEIYFCKLPSR